nr:transposase [Pseudenhygromyxa sp. WMMC2535]
MGRSERREALANYMRGLLLDGERKSMVPIAQRLAAAPGDSEAIRQRLQQAITIADWDEWELFRRLALRVEDKLPGLDAFVIDDTGFPKKGKHSVGVQRQYSGTMGRVDNCQVAASLHLASEAGGACIGMRPRRRTKAGVPEELSHQTKLELGLGMLDRALGRRRVEVEQAGGAAVGRELLEHAGHAVSEPAKHVVRPRGRMHGEQGLLATGGVVVDGLGRDDPRALGPSPSSTRSSSCCEASSTSWRSTSSSRSSRFS